ncbi:peptidyl-prolyl cis-trans isomerase, cyclophilin-type [Gregarina niphandrodes]|uniref:Peptidyl-prolyl cis-trans isomerase, cyclophilin-type n=1 Tax=Gregarina niphandrodes TaxID=110365 RepID=A0A023B0R3_GRENI|nr:peptidyl-prolyl cis-trans isomerase, cyclophilin-type [Gregarina niphandrodes]EZG45806.1 peptidyl-prolyl cis-trans isomerase, cyclophilin-type [Gregarina niphandrodes]|eukprot:XP_011132443.1 peptidyl-prolyl cis-trans isomerase, cyclophilin-type [Gregarina niphandrodes]
MASFRNEPSTTGKVLVYTSKGPLEIELWCRECPKACRNFIQLCKDGYYNGCQVHRIIKGFILQTGDPTNTGFGGESIYGPQGFPVETHGRLLFRYRGLVGMATKDETAARDVREELSAAREGTARVSKTNGSQFFITLDRCDGLNKDMTLFGKVVGESLWNLSALADCEIDPETDKPYYPPVINKTEVIQDPFGCKARKTEPDKPLHDPKQEAQTEPITQQEVQRKINSRFQQLAQSKPSFLSFNPDDLLDDDLLDDDLLNDDLLDDDLLNGDLAEQHLSRDGDGRQDTRGQHSGRGLKLASINDLVNKLQTTETKEQVDEEQVDEEQVDEETQRMLRLIEEKSREVADLRERLRTSGGDATVGLIESPQRRGQNDIPGQHSQDQQGFPDRTSPEGASPHERSPNKVLPQGRSDGGFPQQLEREFKDSDSVVEDASYRKQDVEKLVIKKGLGSRKRLEVEAANVQDNDLYADPRERIKRLRQHQGKLHGRKEKAAQQKLADFQNRLRNAGRPGDWFSERLNFPVDSSNAYDQAAD